MRIRSFLYWLARRLGDVHAVTTGRVLHRVLVRPSPLAVAVDQTTAHLFVANREPVVQASTTGSRLSGQALWGWVPQPLRRWVPWLPHPVPPAMTGSVAVIDTTRV